MSFTWSPSINVYDFSGSTLLSGSVDTGLPTMIRSGSSVSYSSPPTLAQVNAGSDVNQIIAAVNYLGRQYSGSFTLLSYISSAVMIKASDIATIKTGIATVRSLASAGTYTYIRTPASGNKILGQDVAELRKAIEVVSTGTVLTYDFFNLVTGVKIQVYNQNDAPFGSCTGNSIAVPGTCAVDIQTNVSDNGNRTRLCLDIPGPPYAVTPSSIKLKMKPATILTNAATMEWYSSNTDDFSSGGSGCGGIPRPFNTDNGLATIGTGSMSVGASFTLTAGSVSSYSARVGQHFSCILALTNDVSGSDPGPSWRGGASFSKSVGDFQMIVTI